MSDKLTVNQTDLAKIEKNLNQLEPNIIDATELFARVDLRDAWIKSARELAVETGAYVDAIDFVGGYLTGDALREFVLGNDVGYASVVELGRKDKPHYKAKHVVLRALDYINAEDVFEDRLDDAIKKALK